jgi:hypothetical protein
MTPDKVERHIDKRITDKLSECLEFEDILDYLQNNINIYTKMDSYIKVSKRYLFNNWELISWKKRMTTMCVMYSIKRKNDIKWIIDNKHKFEIEDNIKIFNLLYLKDKLKNKEL